ncbi:peptidylprolyl isomerase, partial [Pseudomonas syringae]
MRIVLLCLLLVMAKASWADVPAARVNGVEIGLTRLERYFSEYLDAQGRALTSIRNPGLYKRLRGQALDELIDKELL